MRSKSTVKFDIPIIFPPMLCYDLSEVAEYIDYDDEIEELGLDASNVCKKDMDRLIDHMDLQRALIVAVVFKLKEHLASILKKYKELPPEERFFIVRNEIHQRGPSLTEMDIAIDQQNMDTLRLLLDYGIDLNYLNALHRDISPDVLSYLESKRQEEVENDPRFLQIAWKTGIPGTMMPKNYYLERAFVWENPEMLHLLLEKGNIEFEAEDFDSQVADQIYSRNLGMIKVIFDDSRFLTKDFVDRIYGYAMDMKRAEVAQYIQQNVRKYFTDS